MKSRYKKNKKIRENIKRKAQRKIKLTISITILLLIATLLILGKLIEPNQITVNDYKINNENIPENFQGIKIVHFSDILYKKEYKEKRLKKLVTKINSYKPDIVIFTGDLIDKKYNLNDNEIKLITKQLKKIDTKLGKYAVIGDNDKNNNKYDAIMYDSEFKILKNNYDTIYNKDNNPILLYGLDSSIKGEPNINTINNKEINNITYKIVALHEGDYIEEFINNYDINLVLAGHSLNGQIKIPGIKPLYLPKGAKEYYKKHYKNNNTDIYISNGLGSFKYDYRLFNTPSINVYRLYK